MARPRKFNSLVDDPTLNTIEAAAQLKQAPKTLANWRNTGKGPKYFVIGRRPVYRQSEIDRFAAECEAQQR